MTATQITTHITPTHQVGDRVHVEHRGSRKTGRITSIHHINDGLEYVIHTDTRNGGRSAVLNLWSSSASSSLLRALAALGGTEGVDTGDDRSLWHVDLDDIQRSITKLMNVAAPEQTAQLRGQVLVWQMLLHQACAQLSNLAAYHHSTLRRTTLDMVAEQLRSAEPLLRALDNVLDPHPSDAALHLSVQHLQHHVEREQHALRQAS